MLIKVVLRVLRFSPLLKNQDFQIPIRPGIRQTKNHYVDVLPLNRYLFILFIYLFTLLIFRLKELFQMKNGLTTSLLLLVFLFF